MTTRTLIKRGTYVDSVSLMSLSTKANALPGVTNAVAAMATAMNKEILTNQGLLTDEMAALTPGDLILIAVADSDDQADAAMAGIEDLLVRKPQDDDGDVTFRTIASAASGRPDANVAVISVNGTFAAREAHEALDAGLHVMLFSDNVAIEDEIELKKKAHDKGLLMMGPDCGTAIINGVSLCFANNVRRGRIGIVGASGTGSQEMSVRIHDFTGGISHLLGTGGRDLSIEVGGIMMLDGIDALEADPGTDVIVVVSKPPAAEVAEKVLDRLARSSKPVVVCFLGASDELIASAKAKGIELFNRTKPAALAAVLATGVEGGGPRPPLAQLAASSRTVRAKTHPRARSTSAPSTAAAPSATRPCSWPWRSTRTCTPTSARRPSTSCRVPTRRRRTRSSTSAKTSSPTASRTR